jgi:hypothetical protein
MPLNISLSQNPKRRGRPKKLIFQQQHQQIQLLIKLLQGLMTTKKISGKTS